MWYRLFISCLALILFLAPVTVEFVTHGVDSVRVAITPLSVEAGGKGGGSSSPPRRGCTDRRAYNYDSRAEQNDGSCRYYGCTDPRAYNYNRNAHRNDGSCRYYGCTDPRAYNYNRNAHRNDGSCRYYGCTDRRADNYNPGAHRNDGSCIISGCRNPAADNYNPAANRSNGSCIISGCRNPAADNYNPAANRDDGSCYITGCMNPIAENYNANATQHDNSVCEADGPLNPYFDPDAGSTDPNACRAPALALIPESESVESGSSTSIYCDANGFEGPCRIDELDVECKNESVETDVLTENATLTYTCSNSTGQYCDYAVKESMPLTIEVQAPPVSITATPPIVRRGEQVTISWDPNNFEGTCSATPDSVFGGESLGSAGFTTITLLGETQFTYTCTAPDGQYNVNERSDSVTVRILPMFQET